MKGNMTLVLFHGENNVSVQRWHWFLSTTKSDVFTLFFTASRSSLFGLVIIVVIITTDYDKKIKKCKDRVSFPV